MKATNFKIYLTASFILAGTILGVGIFGLPYVFSASGFLTSLFFLIICCCLVLLNHLICAEIFLRTPGEHRLPGAAKIYLGKWGFSITAASTIISALGVMLAYLILGGQFTQNFSQIVHHPINNNLATIIFWLLGTIGITFGIGFIGISEIIGVVLIIIFIIGFFILGAPHLQLNLLTKINFSQWFLPYGVLLFALSDGSAIPEILGYFHKKNIPKENINLKRPIILGTILPPILYVFFILGAFGLLGREVIPVDLVPNLIRFNPVVGVATDILGIILIITSYFIIGLSLRNILKMDLKIRKWLAWLAAAIAPLALYFLGVQSFIKIIGFIGAVLLGTIIVLTILIHKKSQEKSDLIPSFQIKIPNLGRTILIVLLLSGVALEIAKIF
jgi:amino acid permease